ncbi:Helicase associated domain protein [Streptomyces sp. NPDC059271]|uniref:DEAD/DEAH box helicase n=1 Tax=Streptomyces sp. NPDC059271 TaxID=3346799 RepID=UPI00367914C4
MTADPTPPADPAPPAPAPVPDSRAVLRPDQARGVGAAVRHLRRPHTRGHTVSACGTGKTLMALRTAEELGIGHLAVAVPSLDLLAQWAAAARADGRKEPMIAVSSMRSASHPLLARAGAESTNAGEYLAYWLARHPHATVLFTFDSLSKIEEAQHSAHFPTPVFGLLVVDEAHATAGTWEKNWTALHDNTRIPAQRRLYLTATPYVWEAPRLAEPPTDRPQPKRTPATAPAWDDPALLATMDQPKVFGPRLHTYSHADAISDKVLADYQLVVPTVTDTDLRTILTDSQTHTGFGPAARRTTALHLAILKAMREQNLRHVFVYFQQIADATDFARQFTHTLRALPADQRPDWADQLVVQSIDGTHSPHLRAKKITRFTAAEYGILANAKVLGEGLDLPAVDAIVFADRTASVRRIVQALGRALRKPPTVDTKCASLIIPAYIPPGADPTDLLGTPYEALWLVTAALRHHDQTIAARAPRTKNQHPARDSHTYITRRFRFDHILDPTHIARALDLLVWPAGGAVLSAPRRAGLAAAVRYHAEHGHLRVAADYEDAYGFRLGTFITGMRTARRQGALDPPWISDLEELGMVWDEHEALWQGHMATVEAYLADHGHLAIPALEPGGQFLADQRAAARSGRLDPAREAALTALDPQWQLPYGPDWHRKYHLLARHIHAGHHPGTLTRGTTVNAVKIGGWLHRQLTDFNRLEPGQQELLTRLGFTADRALPTGGTKPRRRTFEQTLLILRMFLDRWQRPPGARESIDVDGEHVMIGPWYTKNRSRLLAGQLPPHHTQMLTDLLTEHGLTPTPRPAASENQQDDPATI